MIEKVLDNIVPHINIVLTHTCMFQTLNFPLVIFKFPSRPQGEEIMECVTEYTLMTELEKYQRSKSYYKNNKLTMYFK